MLFNSLIYIVVFLPLCTGIYFLANRHSPFMGKLWLFFASIFFYGYWNPQYIALILVSILVNFYIGKLLQTTPRKNLLVIGILLNICLLAYYKYTNFFISNINGIYPANITLLNIILPLGISFFTFQKIAYLVDSYQGKCKEKYFIDFCLFVTFFPQLISGPIVHHQEMMPQFSDTKNKTVNWYNINIGMLIFSIGLFKKTVLADTLATWVNLHFDSPNPITFIDAWTSSISYTLQIYFDFSGYTDMAIGSAIMMNIYLPKNFNSPYRATNIKEFWERWHMTLSRWLRDYLYIPLGGNRAGSSRTYTNVLITFFLGGLWHGASWNFVIWGGMHGLATIGHKLWLMSGYRLPRYIAWTLTFLFINISWVFFRANDINQAKKILLGMTNITNIPPVSVEVAHFFRDATPGLLLDILIPGPENLTAYSNAAYILAGLIICLYPTNSSQIASRSIFKGDLIFCNYQLITIALFTYSLFLIIYCNSRISPFIYFNF